MPMEEVVDIAAARSVREEPDTPRMVSPTQLCGKQRQYRSTPRKLTKPGRSAEATASPMTRARRKAMLEAALDAEGEDSLE